MGGGERGDIVSGVGMTALAVAAGRAMEATRADPLVSDPYAAHFVTAARPPVPMPVSLAELTPEMATEALWAMVTEYVGVRTRAFDDHLREAVGHGITQVVLLAPGLDARPFRLRWPSGTVCFELDRPAVLDFKLRTLAERGARPGCTHRPVRAGLREDWADALEAAGFERDRPTVWVAEGLLPCLPGEAEERLFARIGALSAPGSRIAVEQVGRVAELTRSELMRHSGGILGAELGAMVHGDLRAPSDRRLAALGWHTRTVTAEVAAAAYGRTLTAAAELTRHLAHTYGELP
ncbi:SAM-dependent methyltransferase [Streptomyces sp. HNM0574]|nr:SAM-dependent methyltransferase [Streptomyces sp. HNM0574]